ncbi:MAG: hypothetical protein COU65_04515 [Candidatus Pacebacteria bacterium CG10_big_fil_rev_8_21_14_0_10_42_12]|nr:MFS transporter [Candidatus Paceibacterota bacterium]PIR62228.1 MAG: hypothetical protein COU65_04515 [Candidatus Pacebacteria bacterium CG10_big_fil_rev_8_21_14_0_10_42_12]
MRHNIWLAYYLSFLKNTWFWLGIWIFYYLRFTDYAGIGVIETVLIATMTLSEIPTGAFADLIGKKPTIILAFFVQAAGNIFMGIAPSFIFLVGSVFVAGLGGTLLSGTLEALVYDSLKAQKKEDEYDKVISNMNTLQLIAPAVCGVIGGYLYTISPGLPFIAAGIMYLIGTLLGLFLTEPAIDSVKFSLANFVKQTKEGLLELTKTVDIKTQTILLLSIGVIVVIADEMINSFLGVEFGFSETQMGVLWSVIFLVSAAASQATPFLRKYVSANSAILLLGLTMAATFIISPVAGLVVGGLSLLLRSALQAVFSNISSVVINNNTESKYRATTLSTFNMIKNIPYLATAYFIGMMADTYSAKTTSVFLGALMLVFVVAQFLVAKRKRTNF